MNEKAKSICGRSCVGLMTSFERKGHFTKLKDSIYAGDRTPRQAWETLANRPTAALIDVRTHPESIYVGEPDLSHIGKDPSLIPWLTFPTGEQNPNFLKSLVKEVPDKTAHIFFLCRSGSRSKNAAICASQAGYENAYNILGGFEGKTNGENHRGTVSGWKVTGLPWLQD